MRPGARTMNQAPTRWTTRSGACGANWNLTQNTPSTSRPFSVWDIKLKNRLSKSLGVASREVTPKSQTIIESKNCLSSRKGLLSVNCRRQALQLCFDAAVVIVVEIVQQFPLEVFYGLKFLQIQHLTFKQAKEVFYNSIVKAVALATHTLPNTFLTKHTLILLMLVLPTLVGVWGPRSKRRMEFILQHCSRKEVIGNEDCRESYIKRNCYMVDQASYLVAVYDDERNLRSGTMQCVRYTRKKQVPVILIHPDTAVINYSQQAKNEPKLLITKAMDSLNAVCDVPFPFFWLLDTMRSLCYHTYEHFFICSQMEV